MQQRRRMLLRFAMKVAWQGSQTKAEKEVCIMVNSFGSLPHETIEELSLSKSSRSRGNSAPKHTNRKKAGETDETQGVRRELIDRVRAEIAAGTFETPDRIEATIDCILDEILER